MASERHGCTHARVRLVNAVAVVKAGVFTILKVVIYIFGVDFLLKAPAHPTG